MHDMKVISSEDDSSTEESEEMAEGEMDQATVLKNRKLKKILHSHRGLP